MCINLSRAHESMTVFRYSDSPFQSQLTATTENDCWIYGCRIVDWYWGLLCLQQKSVTEADIGWHLGSITNSLDILMLPIGLRRSGVAGKLPGVISG